jgi:hypothetical protein
MLISEFSLLRSAGLQKPPDLVYEETMVMMDMSCGIFGCVCEYVRSIIPLIFLRALSFVFGYVVHVPEALNVDRLGN